MVDKKNPPGGRDKTPLNPTPGTTYIVRFIFHGADNIPAADITGTADPFVLAQINTGYPVRHKVDPKLRFRSATARKSLKPRWEAEWVVGGVPERGIEMKARVLDEDSGARDDVLGKVHIRTGPLKEGSREKRTHKLNKRGADIGVWACRACHAAIDSHTDLDATLTVSFEVLGKSQNVGRAYTMNCFWWIHQSPVLGKIVGTTAQTGDDEEEPDFQANEIQLRGPVPNDLYHRYVEFKGFVKAMYEVRGFGGKGLHRILHRQHEQIYHFDSVTEYGRLEGPGRAMTRRFLDMAHWGEGGRIFTYVITTDGLMRFTETGPEFGIDLLSKHVMHADLDIYIACSGEFIIRKFKSGDLEGAGKKAHKGERDDTHIGDEERANKLIEHKGHSEPPADSALPVHRDAAGSPNEEGEVNGVQEGGSVAPKHEGDADDPLPSKQGKKQTSRQRRKAANAAQFDTPVQQTHLHGPDSVRRSTDPADYELVIDNDSGTYRPDKELLPVLQEFMKKQYEGLHVLALDCQDERLKKIKKKQQKIKEKVAGGKSRLVKRGSSSSLSSSDEEAVEAGRAPRGKREKAYEGMVHPGSLAPDKLKNAFHRHGEKHESGNGELNEKA